jgi:hypothetical protein
MLIIFQIAYPFFSKLISVAEDLTMNISTIENSSLVNQTKLDLNSEFIAVASNSIDKIAIGGEENKVDIHTIEGPVLNSNSL